MHELTPDFSPELGYLTACEGAAPTPKEGKTAFLTWCLAKVCGWEAARRNQSQSTWYRHMAICRQAGLPVPEYTPHWQNFESGVDWFGATSWDELTAIITREPGRLYQLAGKSFVVVQAWDEFYPEGTTGMVMWLQCRSGSWQVECMMDGTPGGNEAVTLHRFLRSTQQVEACDSD